MFLTVAHALMKRIEFEAPPGFIPEDIVAGDRWASQAVFRLKPDGKTVCLVEAEGHRFPGYDEAKGSEMNPGKSEFAAGVRQNMGY